MCMPSVVEMLIPVVPVALTKNVSNPSQLDKQNCMHFSKTCKEFVIDSLSLYRH